MNLEILNILYKASFITVVISALLSLSLLFVVVLHIPQYIRARKLKKIALENELELRNAFTFSINRFFTHAETINVLQGNIHGKFIKIYDSFNPDGIVWCSGFRRNRLSMRFTKLEYDGQTWIVNGGMFGFARVKDIAKLLHLIKHNRGYEDLISDYKPSITHVPYLPLLIILVLIVILIKLSSS